MSTIITRSGKGSLLTPTEVDTNFNNLNTDKLEKSNNLSDVVSASSARGNLGFVSPILDKTTPGPIGETSPSTGKFTTINTTGNVGIGGGPFGQTLLIKSTNTFDILDAPTTAGIHVMGNGVSGVGAYGGAITLAQTGGSTRPGAGIASVQSTADQDQCGLAFMVHGSVSSNNQLQQVGVITATGVATFQSLSTEKVNVTAPAASDGNVYSGTYTPTLTAITNVSALTAFQCQYIRVGNSVTVSGRADATCTTAVATNSAFRIALPLASALGGSGELAGNACAVSTATSRNNFGCISGEITSNEAYVQFASNYAGVSNFFFHFTYKIL